MEVLLLRLRLFFGSVSLLTAREKKRGKVEVLLLWSISFSESRNSASGRCLVIIGVSLTFFRATGCPFVTWSDVDKHVTGFQLGDLGEQRIIPPLKCQSLSKLFRY